MKKSQIQTLKQKIVSYKEQKKINFFAIGK